MEVADTPTNSPNARWVKFFSILRDLIRCPEVVIAVDPMFFLKLDNN